MGEWCIPLWGCAVRLVGQREAARELGLAVSYVNRLYHGGRLPLVDGRIDLEGARRALAQEQAEREAQRERGQAARTLFMQCKAKREQAQYERLMSKLVDRDAVAIAGARIREATIARLRRVPDELQPALAEIGAPPNARQLIAAAIDAALEELEALEAL